MLLSACSVCQVSFSRQVTCTVAAGLKTPKRQQGKEILPQLCLPGDLPRSSACSERHCRVFRTAQNVCSGFRNTEIEGFLGGMSRILFSSVFFVDFHGVGGGRISQTHLGTGGTGAPAQTPRSSKAVAMPVPQAFAARPTLIQPSQQTLSRLPAQAPGQTDPSDPFQPPFLTLCNPQCPRGEPRMPVLLCPPLSGILLGSFAAPRVMRGC